MCVCVSDGQQQQQQEAMEPMQRPKDPQRTVLLQTAGVQPTMRQPSSEHNGFRTLQE